MLALARRYCFGVIASATDSRPSATHIPLLVQHDAGAEDAGISILGHFAAANEQARSLRTGQDVLCIFSGPSGYISPRWYRDEEDVPTYNYAAVHMRGAYQLISDREQVHSVLEKTVASYESATSPPWTMNQIEPELLSKFMDSVICFSVDVTSVEGASKHSQDKSEVDRNAVLMGLKSRGSHADIELAVDMEQSLRPDIS